MTVFELPAIPIDLQILLQRNILMKQKFANKRYLINFFSVKHLCEVDVKSVTNFFNHAWFYSFIVACYLSRHVIHYLVTPAN